MNKIKLLLVDDEENFVNTLAERMKMRDVPSKVVYSGEAALEVVKTQEPDVMVLDLRMPGIDGLALQRRLLEMGCRMPVIIMTGHGDTEAARDAFRAQAVDFLEKPIDPERLLAALEEAFAREQRGYEEEERVATWARLLATLTPREREVMDLVVAGRHNREIAATLGISPRTVEVHKANLQTKLRVDNVPDLVRFSLLGARSLP